MTNRLPPELNEHLSRFDGTLNSLDGLFDAVVERLGSVSTEAEKNRSKFRRMLEQANEGMMLVDHSGRPTHLTTSLLRSYGYREEDIHNTRDFSLSHPDDQNMLMLFVNDLLKTPGKTAQVNFRIRTKSGEWRWVRSNVTNLLHEPAVQSILFSYEDITNEMLLKKQADFDKKNRDALINSTNDLMWSLDREMRLITANRAFIKRIREVTGADIKNGDLLLDPALFPAGDLERWKKRYARALAGESFTVDDVFYSDAADRWEETTINPILEDDKVIGISCFLRDTSEKRNASELIRKSEEMMAQAQNISHFGSWECYLDPDGEIRKGSLKWSDELYRIFGYEPRQSPLCMDIFYTCLHPKDKQHVQTTLRGAVATSSVYEAEYRIIKETGEVRWLRSRGKIILSEEHRPFKMVGTTQDITERKLAERERNKLINDLIQRNKDLEQFAYIVSHNLRAPVTNILGLVHVFNSFRADQQTQVKCCEGLLKAATRLDEVIVDLNQILQTQKEISEKKVVVNLAHLVREVKASIKTYLVKQNGTIQANFRQAESIFTIKSYMYSIFYNLISNSLKYRRPDVPPVIEITSEMRGATVIIKFRDNGMGIDLDINREIFGLYKRFHENIEGKGMGLYMVKTQVEALGGNISVSSKVNAGTEFILEFEQ